MCLIGGTMSVILNLSFSLCVWMSAAVAIIYTLLGGLYSVAYTDVVQLVLIFCSLVMYPTFQRLLLKHTGTVLVITLHLSSVLYFITVDLCSLHSDQSTHHGHQSDADQQHPACSLDWGPAAKEHWCHNR